jgi:hypothetical protein
VSAPGGCPRRRHESALPSCLSHTYLPKVYMELGSYFFVSARTNKRLLHHHHHPAPTMTGCRLVGECEGGCPVLGGRPLRRRAVARVAFGRLCWLGPSWPPVPRLRRPRPPGGGGVESPLQIGVWAEWDRLRVFAGGRNKRVV